MLFVCLFVYRQTMAKGDTAVPISSSARRMQEDRAVYYRVHSITIFWVGVSDYHISPRSAETDCELKQQQKEDRKANVHFSASLLMRWSSRLFATVVVVILAMTVAGVAVTAAAPSWIKQMTIDSLFFLSLFSCPFAGIRWGSRSRRPRRRRRRRFQSIRDVTQKKERRRRGGGGHFIIIFIIIVIFL